MELAGRTHWVPLEEAMAASGIGRSRLYQLLGVSHLQKGICRIFGDPDSTITVPSKH